MRLFVSALLILATSVPASQVLAQEYVPSQPVQANAGVIGMEGPGLQAAPQVAPAQIACPLTLTGATVSPRGGYLPTSQWSQGDGSLHLQFRNNSGKKVLSAAVTAQLRVKANVYSLDATPLNLRLTFSGTDDLDKAADQITHIALPKNVYLYGVVQVALDQVMFADGSTWNSHGKAVCTAGGPGSLRIDAR